MDNIFFNSLEFKSHSGNLIQFVIIENLFKRETLRTIDILKRYFSEKEFEKLVINDLDWNGICDLEKSDHSLKRFFDTLHFYLDKMAPLRKLISKERKLMSKPSISPEILRKCNERDSILKDIAKETDLEKVISTSKTSKC